MGGVLSALAQALEQSVPLALGAAFTWGVLSILLSPCHLASIPLVIGYIGRQGSVTTWRCVTLSITFAIGILITIAAVGGVTAAAGRLIGDVGRIGNFVMAGVFVVVGLYLLDVIRLSWGGSFGDKGACGRTSWGDDFGAVVRYRAWPMHVCLSGSNACSRFRCGDKRCLVFGRTSASICRWALHSYRGGGGIDWSSSALP